MWDRGSAFAFGSFSPFVPQTSKEAGSGGLTTAPEAHKSAGKRLHIAGKPKSPTTREKLQKTTPKERKDEEYKDQLFGFQRSGRFLGGT